MTMIMSQVQIHCGLRPEDERKDLMNAAMDTKRKVQETIPAWLSRVRQAWLVAENHQICTHPDTTKIWLLEQGARLSPAQALQFSGMMLDHETDLARAEKAYVAVDRVVEPDGKKNQTFIMEGITPTENDEVEDATNVLICLSDFGLAAFGDDQFSVTSDDYGVFLAELQDVEEHNFPAFLTEQTSSRMRTWKANKDLKKSSQRDRLYLQKRVENITGKGK